MHVQKTEAERPSHGVQTFVVVDELQWDPRHRTRVVGTASQSVPDGNADIQLTEGSGARLKRQVWTSLLWLMTALWVQVNVLSDRGTSWLGTFYPDVSRDGIIRFVLRLLIGNQLCHLWLRKTGCSTDIVFPPEAAARPRSEESARQPTPSNRVIEVGFDTKKILGLS